MSIKRKIIFMLYSICALFWFSLTATEVYAADNTGVVETLKSRILEAVDNYSEEWIDISDLDIPYTDESNQLIKVLMYDDIMMDYKAFYVGSYATSTKNGEYASICIRVKGEYRKDGKPDIASIEPIGKELDAAVNRLMASITPEMSDVEKVLLVHDYIVSCCDYNKMSLYMGYLYPNAGNYVGVLVEGKAVCSGYTDAFYLFMRMLGIESYCVTSASMSHAWNLVYLDGNWYHVDATWDDPTSSLDGNDDYSDEGRVSHKYFLKSDEEFEALEHYGWKLNNKHGDVELPKASNSGSFERYIFRYATSKINYYDSYWYYFNKGYWIERSKINIEDNSGEDDTIDLRTYCEDLTLLGDRLYYKIGYWNASKISYYDLKTEEIKECINILGMYPDYYIREFAIKKDKLVLVLGHNDYDRYRRIIIAPESLENSAVWADSLMLHFLNDTAPILVQGTVDNTNLVYTSSDTSVVTVDADGMVTSVDGGTAIITVTDKSGNVVAECPVIVDMTFVVSYLEIDETMTLAEIGESKIINGVYGPGYAKYTRLVWSSSDTSVATVDEDGVVTAVGEGTAVITAKVNRGKVSDTCMVTVGTKVDGVTSFVNRMYSIILDRTPDSGSQTWIDGLKNGAYTGASVAEGFIMSNEFLNKNISNEEFVKIMYRAFFGREADSSGLATWKGSLDEGYMKKFVFAGFANSDEFKALCDTYGIECGVINLTLAEKTPNLSEQDFNIWQFVERLYSEVMGRNPDQTGMDTWVGVLKAGTYTGAQVAEGFILSNEFLNKDMTNDEFVKIMYRAFFNRDADSAGFETWTNALETGWTKEAVFAGFANSDEFGRICDEYGIIQGSVTAE